MKKKKEMIPLTHEENNFCNKQEICYMCKENFCMDKDDKNYLNKRKVKDHCHYTGKFIGAAHSICNLNDNDQKEIPVIESNGELNCIGNNMGKFIAFSVPIKKEVSNYDSNDGKKKIITYKLKFIDSFRFMPTSLTELVNNASGIFNSIECKSCIEKNKN